MNLYAKCAHESELARLRAAVEQEGKWRIDADQRAHALARQNAALTDEVARLTLARDTAVNSFTFNYKRANDAEAERDALHELLGQLVAALREVEPSTMGMTRLHVVEALAAAAPYLPPDRPRS